MHSHLAAATVIVIFKDFVIRGRKIKTGWSHSTQKQLQAAAAAAGAMYQQSIPSAMLPQHPMHRPQPNMQMQNPQMAPLQPMPQGYVYPQVAYPQYMAPMAPYPIVHPPNGTGSSTPRSATSGSATPATHESKSTEAKPKEDNSPR